MNALEISSVIQPLVYVTTHEEVFTARVNKAINWMQRECYAKVCFSPRSLIHAIACKCVMVNRRRPWKGAVAQWYSQRICARGSGFGPGYCYNRVTLTEYQ